MLPIYYFSEATLETLFQVQMTDICAIIIQRPFTIIQRSCDFDMYCFIVVSKYMYFRMILIE